MLIKWKTKDNWCDKEQYCKQGNIDPEDGPLEKGQHIKVLFSRKWYEVSEMWIVETQKTRPCDFPYVLFTVNLTWASFTLIYIPRFH